MRVDKNKMNDPIEEYNALWWRLFELDQKLPWEFKMNELRATEIQRKRIVKKMNEIVDMEDTKVYSLPRVG